MHLIGMLDSPYVRRVAISLHRLGLPFTHRPLSVFRDFDAFHAINPVVKAPSLITDDGVVLVESELILAYAARRAGRSLDPVVLAEFAQAQRLVGLALAACEKSVQLVYEDHLRPAERRHQPWIDRVQGQLAAAWGALEDAVAARIANDPWLFGAAPLQADISVAVAWRFSREMLPGLIDPSTHRTVDALSRRAEATAAFEAYPFA